MKHRFVMVFSLSYLVISLSGCATKSRTPFASLVSPNAIGLYVKFIEMSNPGVFKDLKDYKKDGHFHTVAFIAHIAGLEDRATRLACFSQAPDEISRYNAVPVAVWGVISWTYRRRILDSLHSLHGGDYSAVARRRSILHRLVKVSSTNRAEDWKTGFLIHALGDSFAHVHGNLEKPKAFGSLFGHGFSLFNDPDNIFGGTEPNKNYHKYLAYTSSLLEALSPSIGEIGRMRLSMFQNEVERIATWSRKSPLDVISELDAHGSSFNEQQCERLYDEVDDEKVRIFLEDLELELAELP